MDEVERPSPPSRRRGIPWRAWLRAAHRDVGYLLVGLTFVYALSGIAINHIADWNPNFVEYQAVHELGHALPADADAATAAVLTALSIPEPPSEAYLAAPGQLEIELADGRALHVDTASGTVHEEGRDARFFLRVANWLHYNRGKAAWTYIADGYAGLLLLLAISGVFMLKGRKGVVGRGALLIAIGVAVPVLYVHLSGGPHGS
jgi:hypothetical protein